MDMTRSQFLRFFAGAGAGALGLGALASCDGSDPKTPDASSSDGPKPVDAAIDAKPIDAPMAMGNCMQNGTNIVIGTNHGHAMTVPAADVIAGVQKDYQIQGGSGHPHTVTVTAAMFATLQQNTQVVVTSTVDAGHSHQVTIRCA
jgi:hypothetical protein